MTNDEWRTIEQHPNYEVNRDGDVRNSKTLDILVNHKDKRGYETVQLDRQTIYVSKLVADAFCERSPNRDYIMHRDSNKSNNKASNLRWSSRSEIVRNSFHNGVRTNNFATYNQRRRESMDILNKKETKRPNKKVIEVGSGTVYDSIDICSQQCRLSVESIRASINGGYPLCGKQFCWLD